MSEGLLLFLWNNTLEVWEKAPVVVVTKRMTGTGQVVTGARKLYWINTTPSAGNSLVELTNDTAISGTVIYDCFHTDKETHVHSLIPPMPFSAGIYLETFTNMTSVVFGYV